MSHEETFERDLTDLDVLGREIDSMAARVGTRLRASAYSGRTVTLKLRRYDFTTLTRSQTLPQPTDDPRQIASTARRLLADAGTERRPAAARRRGLGAVGLRAGRPVRRGRRAEPLPDVVTAVDAPRPPPEAELPAERALVAGPGRPPRGARRRLGVGPGAGPGHRPLRGPAHRAGAGAHAGGRRPRCCSPPTRPTGGSPP